MKDNNLIQIDNTTWRYEDNGVRFFILEGKERALLIDSGMNVKNVKSIVQSVTDKPFYLINTHSDPDHIGGNCEFSSFMMNEKENYKSSGLIPVKDKDIINLGGRTLEVIFIPGHTLGSIALLDREKRVLFSGDSIQDGNIFLFGPMRDINLYLSSLERLDKIKDQFDAIYPSHSTPILEPSIIPCLIEGTKLVTQNKIDFKEASLFGQSIKVFDIGCAKILIS